MPIVALFVQLQKPSTARMSAKDGKEKEPTGKSSAGAKTKPQKSGFHGPHSSIGREISTSVSSAKVVIDENHNRFVRFRKFYRFRTQATC